MPDQVELIKKIKQVKAAHQQELMRKANVVGTGIGYARHGHRSTQQLCLVVMVSQKLPRELLDAEDIIPPELDGISVDVQEVGELRALD
ncbi:MAG: hypothetical protein JW757_03950 [Anaerolineales bacterium]|nr:hypothetical protein [Anaerolineales bacterium]